MESRPVVLLVEDDQAASSAIAERLEIAGYEVRSAGWLMDARPLIGGCDAMVLDRGLPDGNGYDLIVEHPEVPYVRISGTPDCDLQKPFRSADLITLLQARMGARLGGFKEGGKQ